MHCKSVTISGRIDPDSHDGCKQTLFSFTSQTEQATRAPATLHGMYDNQRNAKSDRKSDRNRDQLQSRLESAQVRGR